MHQTNKNYGTHEIYGIEQDFELFKNLLILQNMFFLLQFTASELLHDFKKIL